MRIKNISKALKLQKILLKHGSDFNVLSRNGSNALHYAAQQDNILLAEYLLKQNISKKEIFFDYLDEVDFNAPTKRRVTINLDKNEIFYVKREVKRKKNAKGELQHYKT